MGAVDAIAAARIVQEILSKKPQKDTKPRWLWLIPVVAMAGMTAFLLPRVLGTGAAVLRKLSPTILRLLLKALFHKNKPTSRIVAFLGPLERLIWAGKDTVLRAIIRAFMPRLGPF